MFLSQVSPLFEKMIRQDRATAIVNQQGDYSFAALGQRVADIAEYLAPWSGKNVLIYGHKQIDAVAAILACIRSSCCFTFVDEANPVSRLQKIALMSGTQLIINTSNSALEGVNIYAQVMTAALSARDIALLELPRTLSQPLFYILPTSGSTGEPKGVRITYANFAAFNAWFADEVTQNPEGCHVNHACLSFDMGILDLIPPLCRGKTVLMLDHKNNMLPRQNIRLMLRNSQLPVTSWFSTPGFAELMLKDPLFCARDFPHFDRIYLGGDRVSLKLVQELQRRFPVATILHAYGPTETTCLTHTHVVTSPVEHESGRLPLGDVRGLNQIVIVDAQGFPLPSGTTGEVRLYGPQVSPGYLPDEHPCNVAFGCDAKGHYYSTGDKGFINAAGSLFICGREDGQFKLNGNRIEVAEIESAAYAHQNVMQCCLAISEKQPAGKTLHLFVQLHDDGPAYHDDFRHHLAQCLPANMIPRSVIFRTDFPMTLHAKIDKKALIKAVEDQL